MAYVIVCNACRHRTPWNPVQAHPARCPQCHVSFGEERADDDVVMPFIRSPKTTSADKLYRDMERGSEVRAEIAAQATGAPVSEMSSLKMTDMKDNLREGDISAKLVPEAGLGSHFQPNGAEHAAGTASGAVSINGKITTGIEPRAGIRAMSAIQGVMGRTA